MAQGLSFIFDAQKGETPASIAQKRALVAQIMGSQSAPSTLGAGFSALGDGIVANVTGRRADAAQEAGQSQVDAFRQMLTGSYGSPGAPATTGGPASVPQGADAASIRQGLIDRGLPEHVADGFLMNFQDESGLNPGINEQNPTVAGSRGGYGLYQLTGPRRVAYEQYAQQRGVDPSDTNAQLDFMMSELQGPEAKAAQSIMAAPDAGSAAAAIARNFLRPAPENLAPRVAKYTAGGQQPAPVQVASLDQSIGMPQQQVQMPAIAPAGGPQAAQVQQQAPMPRQQAPSPQMAQSADTGLSMQQLMQAAGNPFVMAQYGDVINSMISQQMKKQDPSAQLDMQYKQAQIDALNAKGAGGDETYFGNPVPFQDADGNIKFGQIGNKGTFKPIDLGADGGQFVSPTKTVNTETEQIVMDQFGNVLSRMPIQNQAAAHDTAVGKGMGEAEVSNVTGAPQAVANADNLLSQIDGVLNDPNLGQAVGIGGVLPAIPGTSQAGVVSKIDQLQGQAFLQAFATLKGAGQISEVEGAKATAAIARLNRAQNQDDFKTALTELRDIVVASKQRAAEKGGIPLPGAVAPADAGGVVDFSDYFK